MTIDAITKVTDRIIERSKPTREAYLARVISRRCAVKYRDHHILQ